jgi:hypothetical protein
MFLNAQSAPKFREKVHPALQFDPHQTKAVLNGQKERVELAGFLLVCRSKQHVTYVGSEENQNMI